MDKSRLKIIGLTGTNGSGKDTVGALLAERYNYKFISFSDDFRAECRRRGIPVIRENTRMISAEWRREYGLAVMVDRAVEAFKRDPDHQHYTGLVIANLRNPHEADRVHELGGSVLWVDADPKLRYERIQKNAAHRGRAGEDDKTFEQFLQEEADEMHPPAGSDAAVLNMAAVHERADIEIINSTSNLAALERDLTERLGLDA